MASKKTPKTAVKTKDLSPEREQDVKGGKVTYHEVSVTKKSDTSSPALF